MADTIERIYKVTVDATAAVASLKGLTDSTEQSTKKVAEFVESVQEWGKRLVEVLGAREFISRVKETVESFDALGKEAQKLGLAAEDMQRLQFAAKLAGVDSEALSKAMGSLAVNIQHMGSSTDDASKVLRAMGVSTGDSPLAALEKIADHFAKLPNGASKTAEAITLFGKKLGIELIPMLNGGSEGLRELFGDADKFGGIISGSVLKQAGLFTDQLGRLDRASKGAWYQFVIGMIPAMNGLADAFVNVSKQSKLFTETGTIIGTILKDATIDAVRFGGQLQKVGVSLKALAELKVTPSALPAIWKQWREDLREIDRGVFKFVDDVERGTAKAAANMRKPVDGAKSSAAELAKILEDYQKQQEALAEAAKAAAARAHRDDEITKANYEAMIKLQKDLNHDAEENANVQKFLKGTLDEVSKGIDKQAAAVLTVGDAYGKVNEEAAAFVKKQDEEKLRWDALRDLYEKSTGATKEWAQAQLTAAATVSAHNKKVAEQSEEMKALETGFDRYLEALSSGTVSAAQAFRAMTQSIIADLLKIWAKRYIVDALLRLFGGGASTGGGGGMPEGGLNPGAMGLAFDAGAVMPFARGGVLNRAVVMPMALMGEAGPEAVMPLKRGADGALGVAASGGGGGMNVEIHNYADATVTAQRTGPNDLQILIEQTKRSIAADFRRGGNDVARSAESAWGLSRGAAAAF